MATPITTLGLSEAVETDKGSEQNSKEWMESHMACVRAETPAGDTLVTDWEAEDGAKSKQTDRDKGETDSEFMARHVAEYTLMMEAAMPVWNEE